MPERLTGARGTFGRRRKKSAGSRGQAYPARAGGVLEGIRSVPGLAALMKAVLLRRGWAKVAGEAWATRSEPSRISGKTLYVTVTSASWMNELSYGKASLVEKINAWAGSEVITDIVLRPGSITPAPVVAPIQIIEERAVTHDDLAFIDGVVAGVSDEPLRSTIRRALLKAFTSGYFIEDDAGGESAMKTDGGA